MPLVNEKDFHVNFCGLELQHPIMNAAGTCRTIEGIDGVEELANSAVCAVMVGSITMEERRGNEGNVFWTSSDGFYSLNSNGLPNKGAEFYKIALPKMAEICHKANKPLFVSVAGFNPREFAELVKLVSVCGAGAIELNFSCPNLWYQDKQKGITCFDLSEVRNIFTAIEMAIGLSATIGIKISPISDPRFLEALCLILEDWELVNFVTAVNTFPNAFAFDEKGKPVLSGSGYGGLSGSALKPIALGQVKQLRALLSKRIKIIGCGGISTGKDAADFLAAGACLVQVGTAFLNGGVKVFDKILSEYVGIALDAMGNEEV